MLGAFSSFFRSQDEVLSRSPFGIVFCSILEPLETSKIELPLQRESNFAFFALLILRSFLCSISNPKRLPKSSPRGSKIPSETHSKFERSKISILSPTWPNLEANLGSSWAPRGVRNEQKRALKRLSFQRPHKYTKMTPT